MNGLSIAEYRQFHSIDLKLFIRLVDDLSIGIHRSNELVGFCLWLEEMSSLSNGSTIVSKLSNLGYKQLNDFAEEAVCCLGILLEGVLPAHRDLPLMSGLTTIHFNLHFFYENRAAVTEKVSRKIGEFALAFGDEIKEQSKIRALMHALESVKFSILSAPQIRLSVDVISFWLWLEDYGHPYIFQALLIYRHDSLVNLLVEEAEDCLNWLRFPETTVHFDLRCTSALIRGHTYSPLAPAVQLFLANRFSIHSAVSSNRSILERALANVSDQTTRIIRNLLPPIPQHQLIPAASVVPLPTACQGEVAEPVRANNSTRASPDVITTAVTEEIGQGQVPDFAGLGSSIIADKIDDPVEIVQEAVSLITATEMQVQSEEEAPPDQENLNQGVPVVADQNIDQDVPQPQQNGVLEGVPVVADLEGVPVVADQNIDQDVPQPQQNGVLEGVPVVADQNIDQDVPLPAAPVFVIPRDRTILMRFNCDLTGIFKTSITEDDVRKFIMDNYRKDLEKNKEHIERIEVGNFSIYVVFNAPTAIPRVLKDRDRFKCSIKKSKVICTRYT